jgi:putative hydrolase of the HAD superfamily
MPIKCVFFDFDGVLRIWEYEEQQFEEMYGIPIDVIREVAFAPERLHPVVRGQITNDEWRSGVAEELKTRYQSTQVDTAMADWNSRNGRLIPEAIEIARECKKVVPIALFSNATTRLPWELEQHGLTDFFDYVINASDTGYMKPEPEIYQYAVELVGIKPSEAFFTDDTPKNVEAATSLGWTGHVFKNAAGLPTALVDAGVL